MMMKGGCHSKWHMACCWKPLLGEIFWVGSLLGLILAWTASFNSDGAICLKAREAPVAPATQGTCGRGIPVAHLFWDSLVLGVLAIGAKLGGGFCEKTCSAEGDEGDSEEM